MTLKNKLKYFFETKMGIVTFVLLMYGGFFIVRDIFFWCLLQILEIGAN